MVMVHYLFSDCLLVLHRCMVVPKMITLEHVCQRYGPGEPTKQMELQFQGIKQYGQNYCSFTIIKDNNNMIKSSPSNEMIKDSRHVVVHSQFPISVADEDKACFPA